MSTPEKLRKCVSYYGAHGKMHTRLGKSTEISLSGSRAGLLFDFMYRSIFLLVIGIPVDEAMSSTPNVSEVPSRLSTRE